jgi:hypothetical protein
MRLAALVVTFTLAATTGVFAGHRHVPFEGQSLVFGRYHVYQGAWCGHQDTGGQNVEEDCSFDTFERCRFAVVGANNGFCTPNPAFTGYRERIYRKKKKHHAAR